jgi:hypothetical protein
MPRKNHLTDMEIDEISTVDKTANQLSRFVIAKRAPEEDQMPQIYDQEGTPLDMNQLEFGDVVFDDEGQAYEYVEETDEDEDAEANKDELVETGKSAFFEKSTGAKRQVAKRQTGSFSQQVMEELSKAFSDDDRDAVIVKALSRVEELEKAQQEAAQIAKSERDLRLTREYVSKAADYNLPVAPEELGPVLYRMAETMSYDDCSVIAKCLETAGTILFEEAGYQGGGDNADIYSQVEAHAHDVFGKAEDYNTVEAVNKVFDANPDAYDEYLLAQRNR